MEGLDTAASTAATRPLTTAGPIERARSPARSVGSKAGAAARGRAAKREGIRNSARTRESRTSYQDFISASKKIRRRLCARDRGGKGWVVARLQPHQSRWQGGHRPTGD